MSSPPVGRKAFYRFIARQGAWLLAREITERGEAKFIDYVDDRGQHVWPVFSTERTATLWVEASSRQRILSFPCLQLTPTAFLQSIPPASRVLFDPKSPWERIMTEADLSLLKQLLGGRMD
jgi:hypothetical protein